MTDSEKKRVALNKALVQVALGQREAELCVRNGKLVNVYSGEILDGQDVAISGGRIAYVGPPKASIRPGSESIDVRGSYLVPGFVDAHAHVDFFANPVSLTPHLLAGGTTAVMADPHEAVGALGLPGLEMLVGMTRGLPLKFYFSVPVATPPLPEVEGEPILGREEVASWLKRPEMRAIAEVTPWVRLLTCDEDLLAKFVIAQQQERRIEGHTTGASFQKLNALVAAGLTSCHEAINAGEARDRLRLGLYVMLRHGSIRRDLDSLLAMLYDGGADTSRVMLTPDWMDPPSILSEGYMDSLVRSAIERGVDPLVAIQMASRNPATYLGLDFEIGGIAPGRHADIVVVDDLRRFEARLVIAEGRVVARDGQYVGDALSLPDEALAQRWLPHRILPSEFLPADFDVRSPSASGTVVVPAIHIVDRTITERQDVRLPVEGGQVQLPGDADVLKIAVLNTELPGFRMAFLTGLGARPGGLASSLAHEPHRPLAIGCSESDMVLALNRMRELGGGVVLVNEGEVVSEIPLPVGGLMSTQPLGEVAAQIERMNRALQEMGCPLKNPVFTIGFLTFSPLPWVRLTPEGVWDVKSGKVIWPASGS